MGIFCIVRLSSTTAWSAVLPPSSNVLKLLYSSLRVNITRVINGHRDLESRVDKGASSVVARLATPLTYLLLKKN